MISPDRKEQKRLVLQWETTGRELERIRREALRGMLYNWKDVDALLDEAATYPGCDVQGRSMLYGEFARLMGQEYPIVPLFVPHDQLLVRETVFGVNPGAFAGPVWNAQNWASVAEE